MDWQAAFNIVFAILLLGGGFWFRTVWNEATTTKSELVAFRIKVAEEYMSKDDLHTMMSQIMERFDKLEQKLERKADK